MLLLHGLWGGSDSWREYSRHLVGEGWNEACVIEFAPGSSQPEFFLPAPVRTSGNLAGAAALSRACPAGDWPANSVVRVVFRDADGQSFLTQGQQVASAVDVVRRRTGAGKVSLIGHSMGGLAARAYLQSGSYRGDVSAVATVATPHLGSLIPYLAREPEARLCGALAGLVGRDLSAPAVGYLAPDGPELLALDFGRSPFGPLPKDVRWLEMLAHFSDKEAAGCATDYRGWLSGWNRDLAQHYDAAAAQSMASGGVLANWTDGVVPVVSQMLTAVPVAREIRASRLVVEAFHSDVTGAADAWAALDRFLLESGPSASQGGLSIALLVDSSGSMAENDPQDLRLRASDFLLERLPEGTSFTVVDFDSTAKVIATPSTPRTAVREALLSIDSAGGTALCQALETGFTALSNVTDRADGRKAAILLTDGQSKDECSALGFADRGWGLFTVGLSSAADGRRLSQLAREGGGRYVHALSATDLAGFFDVLAADLLAEETFRDFEGIASPAKVQRVPIEIDPSARSVSVTLTWPGSDLDLTLVAPSGQRWEATTAGRVGRDYELLTPATLEPGTWIAEVASIDVPAAGEAFRLRATGRSGVGAAVDWSVPTAPPGVAVSTLAVRGFKDGEIDARAVSYGPTGVRRDLNVRQGIGRLEAMLADVKVAGPYLVRWSIRQGAVVREVVDSVFVGQPMDPRQGLLTRVEGSYLVWDRGTLHGIRPGMTMRFYRSGVEVGRGQVLSVRDMESDLEVFETFGVAEMNVGDQAFVDASEWIGASR